MEEEKIVQLGNSKLSFDKELMILIGEQGKVKLDRKVSLLLEFFLERQDRVVTRTELIENVWQNSFVSNDAINRAVSVLRKALGGDKDSFIITIPKVGYRFSIPSSLVSPVDSETVEADSESKAEIVSRGTFANVELTSSKPSGDPTSEASDSKSPLLGIFSKHLLIKLSLSLVTLAVIFFSLSGEVWQKPTSSELSSVTRLAVLPFRNLSNHSEGELFSAGLTDEVINNLARLEGTLILNPGASFIDDSGAIKLKAISEDIDAQYVLTGSVRNEDSHIKIAIQLTNAETGELLFSNIFERDLVDFFDIQEDLSHQIRSALNLTLRKNIDLYSQQIERLDFVAIEQLVIARAKIMKFTAHDIEAALEILQQLNQIYPETPEVIGLLAFGSFQLNSSTNVDIDNYLLTNIALAEKALALDPHNLDALYTLANIYIGFPDWRERGHKILKQLLKNHPGRASVYMGMLFNFNILNPNCTELTDFIKTIPPSVFNQKQMAALHYVSEPCNNTFESPEYSRRSVKEEILWITYNLYLAGDNLYRAVDQMATQNPNSRYLAELYDYQVFAGAFEAAKGTRSQIQHDEVGVWTFTMDMIGYLFGVEGSRRPSEYFSFVKQTYRNASLPGYSSALIKQAREENRPELVNQFLESVPDFPVSIKNRGEAVGMAFLLHYAGDTERSVKISKELYNKLEHVWTSDRASYHFWNMAPLSFLTAVYQDDMELAQVILKERFPEDYEYWFIGLESSRSSLWNWREEAVVKEYLSRIELDQSRFRSTYSLDSVSINR